MSDAGELLAQLRDIRIPEPAPEPALWPLLVTLVLLFAVLCWLVTVIWRRKNTWAHEVKVAISTLQTQPPDVAVHGYAALLKRTVMTIEPESAVRTTYGESWLQQLDRFFKTDYFTNGDGQLFGNSLYKPIIIDQTSSARLGTQLKRLVTRRSLRLRSRLPAIWRTLRS